LFWAAIAVVASYAVFAALSFYRAGDGGMSDVAWSHTVWVVQGVEAIAFTAVGWLFGREVRRGAAEAAQHQAHTATQDAQAARADAQVMQTKVERARDDEKAMRDRASAAETAGSRLAEAVRTAGAMGLVRQGAPVRQVAGGGTTGPADPVRELADRLFPPS
jgi:hypothetical protein